MQCRHALKPDGLLLGAMLGGNSLQELRIACAQAEQEMEGGVASRISPLTRVRRRPPAGGTAARAPPQQPAAAAAPGSAAAAAAAAPMILLAVVGSRGGERCSREHAGVGDE